VVYEDILDVRLVFHPLYVAVHFKPFLTPRSCS
jgi:hypothetical protein